jgi:hypothetical protein
LIPIILKEYRIITDAMISEGITTILLFLNTANKMKKNITLRIDAELLKW